MEILKRVAKYIFIGLNLLVFFNMEKGEIGMHKINGE